MENTIKYWILVYLVLNIGLTFVWPSYRVWKQTGIFPVTFSNKDTAHDYIGNVFKMLLVVLLLTGGVYTFYPDGINYLLPIWYLDVMFLKISGMVILFVALAWIALAQFQMANSWRIGIDEKNKTSLVTRGVFSISRNPIFLGMLSSLFGFFLVIPSAITFTILVTAFVVVQIQVRLEEAFLYQEHGASYQNYCQKTRRWL